MTTLSEEIIHPPEPPGLLRWVRENLFNSWFNAILTLASLALLYAFLSLVIRWVFFQADWRPIAEFPMLFMVGQYPRDLLWRVALCLGMVSFLLGLSWGAWGKLIQPFAITMGAMMATVALIPAPIRDLTWGVRINMLLAVALIFAGFFVARRWNVAGKWLVFAWTVTALLMVLVILPGMENSRVLTHVPTTLWGGLLVTMILAIGGIVLSFPIGVLLALGRRSNLPVVKGFSILFIEVIRGVPLITILFMFSLILQVFLPVGSRFDRLLRALIGITVFSAAYMAENVRGGLQAIPLGQIEAAKALGMNGFQINLFIVLPQALRMVIPAIVGQFISLFKDTTLVIILGINELLGIGRAVIQASPEYVRLQLEVYLFIALIFWVFSYAMSYSSQQLERALGVGER